MSPRNTETTSASSPNPNMALMRSRREAAAAADPPSSAAGRSAGGAADGAAADGVAVAVPETPGTGQEIIGQEIVLASTALVPLSAEGRGQDQRVANPSEETPNAVRTPVAQLEDRFQSPMPRGTPIPNGITREGVGSLEAEGRATGGSQVELRGPQGPPTVLGPAATPASTMLPLFTPEQSQQFQQLDLMAPFAGNRSRVQQPMTGAMMNLLGMSQGSPQVPGSFVLPQAGYDQGLQELHDQRAREALWKAQVEQLMSQMGLQLRASQAENDRLRDEVRQLRSDRGRSQSAYHTPEDVPRTQVRQAQEDGTRVVQQVSTSQEDGTRVVQQVPTSQEDGARVAQQVSTSQEDGARVAQQVLTFQEDGARAAQQASTFQEDGARAAQQEWNLQEDGATGAQQDFVGGWTAGHQNGFTGSQPGRDEGGARTSSGGDQTMEVILRLMEGMQAMQRQFLNGREERREEAEMVRHSTELPRLPEWDPETAPIDFSDWQLCLSAHMGDLSNTSEAWWEETMRAARDWYEAHMRMTPMQRLTHLPSISQELRNPKWTRLERRASALLMAALPDQLKEEVISSKQVTALGIMCKAMIQYQPGGLSERAAILKAASRSSNHSGGSKPASEMDPLEKEGD